MKKIYVKINGEFAEFEDTPQIRQGLHLDKQIAEQAGGDFHIFEPEQLSDEDALKLGVRTEAEIFEKKRREKYSEIQGAFSNEFINGSFFSETLQIEVDCRRAGEKNDIQNVETLIKDYEFLTEQEKYFVGKTEITSFPLTLEQLELLRRDKDYQY